MSKPWEKFVCMFCGNLGFWLDFFPNSDNNNNSNQNYSICSYISPSVRYRKCLWLCVFCSVFMKAREFGFPLYSYLWCFFNSMPGNHEFFGISILRPLFSLFVFSLLLWRNTKTVTLQHSRIRSLTNTRTHSVKRTTEMLNLLRLFFG